MGYKLSLPPAYSMLGLLACSEAYEFGQLGTGLSWSREYTVLMADELFFLKNRRHP